MNFVDYIINVLKKGGYTEKTPFCLQNEKVFLCHIATDKDLRVAAKYVYTKDGIPFVATSKYDEVAVECLNEDDIKMLAALL